MLSPIAVRPWWAGGWIRVRLTRTCASRTQEGGGRNTHGQYKSNAMKKLIGISLCATLAAAILVAPGGAAKPAFSVTCTLGTGGQTTVTWISGTTSAHITWRESNSTPLAETSITVTTHGPDFAVVDTPQVNPDSADVNYYGKKLGFATRTCEAPA